MEFKGAVRSLPGKMYEIIPGVSLSMWITRLEKLGSKTKIS
jgi:hypothetical protein